MKIELIKNKYYLAIFVLILLFSFSNRAHAADTYATAAINGIIWATVDILPSTTMSINSQFTVTGQLTSSSSSIEEVGLSASNNGALEVPLVPLVAGGTIFLNPGASSSLNTQTFNAPGTPGTGYNVTFITYVMLAPIQNYSYTSNGGVIMGICSVVQSNGEDPVYIAHRDAATEADAIARGITHVVVNYQIATDNFPAYCSRSLVADFYPGDLDVSGYFNDGRAVSDFTCGTFNYCSSVIQDGNYQHIFINEY